jgi:hypothetical protein
LTENFVGEPGVKYRQIPGAQEYMAGTDGSIWSCRQSKGKRWKKLKSWPDEQGFMSVKVWCGIGEKAGFEKLHVGQLVLLAFVGPPPPDTRYALRHNGNNSDDSLDNLYWGSRNRSQAAKVGQTPSNAKLSLDIAREIRAKRQRRLDILKEHAEDLQWTLDRLAEVYGVDAKTIEHILAEKTWKEPTCSAASEKSGSATSSSEPPMEVSPKSDAALPASAEPARPEDSGPTS